MPHSLILGSALATQDRLPVPPLLTPLPSQESKNSLEMAGVAYTSRLRLLFNQVSHFFVSAFRVPPVDHSLVHPKSHVERENNSLAFVKAHLYHGIVDVMASLLGFAVMINSLYVTFYPSLTSTLPIFLSEF
jgi:metal iron transporter